MSNYLSRSEVIEELLRDIDDEIVVAGLGSPVSDVARVCDRDLNFYLLGAMGLATPVGFGIALAQPDRSVIVVTGDAELMMNIGILATIGVRRPKNLAVVVFDNERFGETGQQLSHTSLGVDIAGIALASGFARAETVRERPLVRAVAQVAKEKAGPYLAVIKVDPGRVPIVLPIKDGVIGKARFRKALVGSY